MTITREWLHRYSEWKACGCGDPRLCKRTEQGLCGEHRQYAGRGGDSGIKKAGGICLRLFTLYLSVVCKECEDLFEEVSGGSHDK